MRAQDPSQVVMMVGAFNCEIIRNHITVLVCDRSKSTKSAAVLDYLA